MLDTPVDESEVRLAILSIKAVDYFFKSPGLDGFSAKYYKKYNHIVAPILTEVYTKEILDIKAKVIAMRMEKVLPQVIINDSVNQFY